MEFQIVGKITKVLPGMAEFVYCIKFQRANVWTHQLLGQIWLTGMGPASFHTGWAETQTGICRVCGLLYMRLNNDILRTSQNKALN